MTFNYGIEEAIQKVEEMENDIRIGRKIKILAITDDIAITAENIESITKLTRILIGEIEKTDLKNIDLVKVKKRAIFTY